LFPGPLEEAAEQLIVAATEGNVNQVEDLLSSGKVSADVADSNGHTPLVGAAVSCWLDLFIITSVENNEIYMIFNHKHCGVLGTTTTMWQNSWCDSLVTFE